MLLVRMWLAECCHDIHPQRSYRSVSADKVYWWSGLQHVLKSCKDSLCLRFCINSIMAARMDLPVEIWMRVFELLDEGEAVTARRPYIQRFIDASGKLGESEESALKILPNHERKVWTAAKRYYGINANSRAAAQRTNLTIAILRGSNKPAENLYRACLGQNLEASSASFRFMVQLQPTVTVELFGGSTFAKHLFYRQRCYGSAAGQWQRDAVDDVVREHEATLSSMSESWALCSHVTRFELLSAMAPGREHLQEAASKGALKIKSAIEGLWKDQGAAVEVVISM